MGIIETLILMLLAACIAVEIAPRVKLPLELFLLLGSIVISLFAGESALVLDPELVFFVFLPPVLFSAAYFTSWRDFRREAGTISLLAIGLVIFTVVGIAVVIKEFIPSLPWAAAFLFGAIVSPPDASAATALAKKLGLPRRLLTVIEGESLVNDATALICFQFALASLASGEFILKEAVIKFMFVSVGGIVLGLAIGKLGVLVMKHLHNSTAESLLTMVTGYACYILGEKFHVSGVMATVVAGLYFGRMVPNVTEPKTRLEAEAFWNVWNLAINCLIFTFIGLQLPGIVDRASGYGHEIIVFWAALSIITLILIRFIWIFAAAYVSRFIISSLREADPTPPWQVLTVLSWTGMRGIVSLAAALSIPQMLSDRDLLIFLTYAVILVTLGLPTLTLPWMVRRFNLTSSKDVYHQEIALARWTMAERVLEELGTNDAKDPEAKELTDSLLNHYRHFASQLRSNLHPHGFSALDLYEQKNRKIHLDALAIERETLLKLRADGRIHDEVFHELHRELDVEELRAKNSLRPS